MTLPAIEEAFMGVNPSEPQSVRHFGCHLPVATNSGLEILRYALIALEAIFKEG